MNQKNQTLTALFIVIAAVFSWMNGNADSGEHHSIYFGENEVYFDNEPIQEYDLTWSADPAGTYNEIKNAPAIHFSGSGPKNDSRPWIGHDLIYYPAASPQNFQKISYDGSEKWAQYHTSEENANYIFGLLPVLGNDIPVEMTHTPEEAFENPKLHITRPGSYELSGQWQGQIWVDLGEDAFSDPNAVVTLILNGLDLRCTAAPAIVFYQTYECDGNWESQKTHSYTADLNQAGARIFLSPGSENFVQGKNVPSLLSVKYKKSATPENPVQKKLYKMDGAITSDTSLVFESDITNPGKLVLSSSFEGISGELHLAFNGGTLNIESIDDGVNASEDGVSIIELNGADLTIHGGQGTEGDGIDSNGFLVLRGGTVIAAGNSGNDTGIDADSGVLILGGTLAAFGEPNDWPKVRLAEDMAQTVLQGKFDPYKNLSEGLSVMDNSTGKETFHIPAETYPDGLPFSGFLLTSPELLKDNEYTVQTGFSFD